MCGNIDPEEERFVPTKNVRSTVRMKPRKDTHAVCHNIAEKKDFWISSADFVKRI